MRLLPWLAKFSFACLVLSLVAGAVAGLGTRIGAWDYKIGIFVVFPWCVGFALLGFLIGFVWACWALIANRGTAARFGIAGALGSLAIAVVPLADVYAALTCPRIHDISTATDHAPLFVALKADRQGALTPPEYEGAKLAEAPDGKTESTAALQRKYYPDIFSRAEITTPDKLFDRAVKTAYHMGWHVVAVVPKEGRIEATDTGLLFGLTEDIVIRVKAAGMGARLDIRAKSRRPIWKNSDIGTNAAHIRSFLKTLANTY